MIVLALVLKLRDCFSRQPLAMTLCGGREVVFFNRDSCQSLLAIPVLVSAAEKRHTELACGDITCMPFATALDGGHGKPHQSGTRTGYRPILSKT